MSIFWEDSGQSSSESLSCVWLLRPHGLLLTRVLCPRDSPGKNTGVGCHGLLQGIFLTQGSNPCLFVSPALAGTFFTTRATWHHSNYSLYINNSLAPFERVLSHSAVLDPLKPHALQPTRLPCSWTFPGKKTRVGIQGIFPTQELNPGLLHCRQILYQLSYTGSEDSSRISIIF